MGTLDKGGYGYYFTEWYRSELFEGKELSAFRNRQIGFVFQFHQLLLSLQL